MAEFNQEQFNELINTTEGQAFLEEQKAGLVNKRDELLSKLTNANDQLKSYKELGDPDEIKTTIQSIREEQQKAIDADAEAKAQYLSEQVEKYKNDFSSLQATLVNDKVQSEITKAIASARGDIDILLPLLTQRVKGEYVDGQVTINVLENGEVAHKDGERMSVASLVDQMKANHPNLFEVSASGTGTKPNQTATQANNTYDFNDSGFNMTKAADRQRKNSSYTSTTKRFGWRSS